MLQYYVCNLQDGKKGFHDDDDDEDDDDVDFDGLFGDGDGSIVKTSPDRLASHAQVRDISATYSLTLLPRSNNTAIKRATFILGLNYYMSSVGKFIIFSEVK